MDTENECLDEENTQPEEPELEEDIPEEAEEDFESKYAEQNEKYLRLLAEYDNFRKRSIREREEIYPAAAASAAAKFLPILDNLERAAAFPHPDDDFGKGFDMILKSFSEVITALGIEQIGTVGEPFNPQQHNAVTHIDDENLGVNVVAQVLQKGYRMGDKILRYAMVQTAN